MSGLEDQIRRNRLFILGAGFSAGAGIPMTGKLLATAMRKFSAECPGLYSRVNGHVRTCFALDEDATYDDLDFAEICTFLYYKELREYGGGERWTDAGSRENLALRYYLAKTIVELTPQGGSIPGLYLRFARQLGPSDIVLTFNWDCLLEAAFEQIQKPYTYTYRDGVTRLLKLHGSVNWRLELPQNSRFPWEPLGFTEGMMEKDIYWCRELQRIAAWEPASSGLLGEIQPFLVLPGFGKASDVRHLAPLWYKPEFAFSYTHDVFALGLSLARDDFIIRSFFVDNLPYASSISGVPGRNVFIVNPDPATRGNYGFLLGAQNVHFLCERFSLSHVEMMERSGRREVRGSQEELGDGS